MELMDRANDRRRVAQHDRLEHRLDETVRDNACLEQANELLKSELDREERERDHLWHAMDKGMRVRRSSVRMRRVLVVGAGLGAAYVAGTRAGRGRYDEIVAWWDRLRGRAGALEDELQRTVTARTNELTNDLATTIERGAARTGDTIEERGHQAAGVVRAVTKG